MNSKFYLKGTVILERRNHYTGEVLDHVELDNLIVNDGLEGVAKLLTGDSTTSYSSIGIGTGTTAAANDDTTLETEVDREAADNSGDYESPYKAKFEKLFTFSSGESWTITEAGLFDNAVASGSSMFDRFTFSGLAVSTTTDLYVRITITAARA